MRRRHYLLLIALLISLPVLLSASPRAESGDENVTPTFEKLYSLIGKEKYAEAKKQADSIRKRGNKADRAKLAPAYGRLLLSLNLEKEARGYLKTMKQARLDADKKQLMDAYAAWLAGLEGQQDEAIATLKRMLNNENPYVSTADAADILAILHLTRGERQEAQRAVDFGLNLIAYYELKTDYTETLLRGRMNSKAFAPRDLVKELYDKAEKLRHQKKYAEAGRQYYQLRTRFPTSIWNHAAGFRIGQCHAGLKRSSRALAHWESFIEDQPDGPWRGQAHVAVVDLMLIEQFDADAAAEHLGAASQTLEGQLDAEAAESWIAATYDIRFRQGMLAMIHERYEEASTALRAAKSAATGRSKEILGGLDRLIEHADDRRPINPQELQEGDDRASIATGLASIYALPGHHDQAKKLFGTVVAGSRRSKSPPHRSYAEAQLAGYWLTDGDHQKALRGYESSLKLFPSGSWHDDSLRAVALHVEGQALAKLGPAKTEQDAKYIAARAAALTYWTRLYQDYPESPHVPQALYHSGLISVDVGKPDAAEKLFERLIRDHPASPWTGDAHIWLVDVSLEHKFDLSTARQHAKTAIAWLTQLDHAHAKEARAALDGSATALRTLKQVSYDIYVRAGIIEYLDEHYGAATDHFRQAKPFAAKLNVIVAFGKIFTGIELLMQAAAEGRSLTPEEVRAGDEKAKLILMLADLYLRGRDNLQAVNLYGKVIDGTAPDASDEQIGWAMFRQGRAYFMNFDRHEDDPDKAYKLYLAAARTAPKAPWTPKALMYAANMRWNRYEDLEGAVKLWTYVLEKYPDSGDMAARCHYLVGVAYHWGGHPVEAKKSLEDFLDKRPDSKYARLARVMLQEVEADLLEKGKSYSNNNRVAK